MNPAEVNDVGDVQELIARRLMEDPYLKPLDVMAEDKGNIEQRIKQRLAAFGVSIVVLMGSGRCPKPNMEGPYLDPCTFIIEIAENVMMNRGATGTQKTASRVLWHVLYQIHQYQAAPNLYFLVDDEAFKLVENPPGASLTYHVRVNTSFGLQKQP